MSSRHSVITGVDVIDDVVSRAGRTVLLYGGAGVGKTTLLLEFAKKVCNSFGPCLYLSTEETLHYEKVARWSEEYKDTFFMEIYDFDEMINFILKEYYFLPFRVLFVDSVNSLFRIASPRDDAISLFGLMLAIIRRKAYDSDGFVFASAQVRAGFEYEAEEIVASGMTILDYWFDVVIYLGFDDGRRYIEFIKPVSVKGFRLYFIITDEGVEWVERDSDI